MDGRETIGEGWWIEAASDEDVARGKRTVTNGTQTFALELRGQDTVLLNEAGATIQDLGERWSAAELYETVRHLSV